MSELKGDIVGAHDKKAVVRHQDRTEQQWTLLGACVNAAVSAGGLASLLLYAGISPKPRLVYLVGFYVPVSAGLAMYLGLRYLRQ